MTSWTIVGAGALGCTFASLLVQSGQGVSLLMRDHYRGRFHPGIDFTDLKGRGHLIHTRRLFACDLMGQHDKIQRLLVTTKVFQIEEALSPLVGRICPEVPIILMHNGMGSVETVSRLFPDNPILQATTTNGALRSGPFIVRQTGGGETWIGAANAKARDCAEDILESLGSALPHLDWSDQIEERLWSKLAINCVINPLTALHRCRNGDLLEDRFHDTLEQLYDELFEVMKSEGLTIPRQQIKRQVEMAIQCTAENYSSMNRDLMLQRRSEIEQITGFVLSRAQRHGLRTPVNHQLYIDIKEKESSYV
ncbi:ketopantoate reductase family protein [Dongshaea marina]|uniref:ketopantoate reductase family protein n=1 Tax=Dongshaea marina TaxID=2047966 RepID=UPI000D3E05CD|nr:2-dehydropantoate 2-reductase [Dongshaea marina]